MTSSGTNSVAGREPVTMADVERVIEHHRAALVQHPFLLRLEGEGTLEQFRRMLPRLAFFALVFQDVLRLAREHCSEPELRAIAARHELEDKGHDHWYLDDLARLEIPLDVRWLFSAEHSLARDVAYRLVSEVLRATDDRSRLSVMLSLEAIGREFFTRVPGFAARAGTTEGLTYFAIHHLDVEKSHDVFGGQGKNQLAAIDVPDRGVLEILAAIEHTFDAMAQLADDLEEAMRKAGDDTSNASGHFRTA
jgi:hypothetical protein